MQNTAATCLFFIDHWGPKKNQDKQRDSPKVGTGLSAVATVAFSPKNVGSGSIPLTKEFCLPRFTWLATHNWAFFEKLLRPDFLWKFLHLFNLRWGDGTFHSTWDQNGKITSVPSTSTKSSGGPHESVFMDLFPHNDWLEVGSKSQPAFFQDPKKRGRSSWLAWLDQTFGQNSCVPTTFGPWIVAILGFWASNFGIASEKSSSKTPKKVSKNPISK